MKKFVLDFLHRGAVACGLGPIVLAIIYCVLGETSVVESLSVSEVCIGIVSVTLLAFIAGGMNSIYQLERLPLMIAIFIHGSVLYLIYLVTYLLNGWIKRGVVPLIVFSSVFLVGYMVIWTIIYAVIRHRTRKVNACLKMLQLDVN